MLSSEQERFLQTLVEDLHASFSLVAYVLGQNSARFIRARQKYLEKAYNPSIEAYDSTYGKEKLLDFVDSDVATVVILPLYSAFEELLELSPKQRRIRAAESAEELSLLLDGEHSMLNPGMFSKYCKSLAD